MVNFSEGCFLFHTHESRETFLLFIAFHGNLNHWLLFVFEMIWEFNKTLFCFSFAGKNKDDREAANTNFIVFDLTWPVLKPTIYGTALKEIMSTSSLWHDFCYLNKKLTKTIYCKCTWKMAEFGVKLRQYKNWVSGESIFA